MKVTSEFKPFTIHIESQEECNWLKRLLDYGAEEMAAFIIRRKPFVEIEAYFMECIRFSEALRQAINAKGINK
jgi:hypothetical protein